MTVEFLPPFVCLSVFSHDISKTDAVEITKFGQQMFHDEFWIFIYFGVKRAQVKVASPQKTVPAWIFALL